MQKGLLLIALPLLYQALFIGLLLRRQTAHNEAQRAAVHTKEVLVHVDRIFSLVQSALADVRGFVLTENPRFSKDSERARAEVESELKVLGKYVADNPDQTRRWRDLSARSVQLVDYENQLVALVNSGQREQAQARVASLRGVELLDKLTSDFDEFRATEESFDQARLTALAISSTLQNWLLVLGLTVNVVIGAACAAIFGRGISRRLAVLTQNTARIARGEALVPRVGGRDEISELDSNFHAMSEQLAALRQKERVFQTVLERRNEELIHANRDLDAKSRENEMFVYSVSHDLRSPLVNLQGFSKELGLIRRDLKGLFDEDLTEAARDRARMIVERDIGESIHYIQTAVQRLSSIIDALLRLSRIGRVEYRAEVMDLAPVIARILAAMRGTIAARGAKITVQEMPPAFADPTAIEQIFANLIGNAVNYLDAQRPGEIEVGCLPDEALGAKGKRVFYVKDNGLGIADAHLSKVFAVFQRLHAQVAPGEGIGLPIVRRMVERHGGEVWVESKEGVGSTFFVSLPAGMETSPLAVAPKKESIRIAADIYEKSRAHDYSR